MTDAAAPRTCPMCSISVTADAAFCSACGAPLGAGNPVASPPRLKWYYNVWFVLFMLFFVLGPFGLPLVWKHPRFARWGKWTLTVLMALCLWLLVNMTMAMVGVITQHLQQFQSSLSF